MKRILYGFPTAHTHTRTRECQKVGEVVATSFVNLTSTASPTTPTTLQSSTTTTTTTTTSTTKQSRSDVQIVVIGAGLAGLSAASHLIQHGFTNTVVLEATERFGGRVNSKFFGDSYCELGAKRIPIDSSKDSIYELIQQVSGLQKEIQGTDDKMYVNADGEQIDEQLYTTIDRDFRRLCNSIELEKKVRAGDLHDLNNVHTYLLSERNKLVNAKRDQREQMLTSDIFTSLTKEFSSLMGCCLEYVNIEHITKLPPNTLHQIYIPSGMDNVLSQIAGTFDDAHILKGKPVGAIQWRTSSPKKSVGCVDGTAYAADHIICTLPLGVLKNFAKFMFNPTLPNEKLNSIKRLGFGTPLKIYFEYKKNVRPWFTKTVRPVWSAAAAPHKQSAPASSDLNWARQIIEISRMRHSRRVLEVLIGGAFYEEIEKLPDKEIQCEVTKVLRKFLRNTEIPCPTSLLRSNWSSSACFLGGQPYFSTGSSVMDVTILAAPLGEMPVLLFAGDATIVKGFGSLDGARWSGIREANRIIDYYGNLP